MLNRLAEQLLSMLLSQFATPDKIREYADLLKRALYRAVDVLIAAIVTAILSYLNQPSDGVVLGVYGDTPAAAVGSATLVFSIISAVRYFLPIILAVLRQLLKGDE